MLPTGEPPRLCILMLSLFLCGKNFVNLVLFEVDAQYSSVFIHVHAVHNFLERP